MAASQPATVRSFLEKAYRVRGIPTHYQSNDVDKLLRSALLYGDDSVNIRVRSLALTAERDDKVAIVNIGGELPESGQKREVWYINPEAVPGQVHYTERQRTVTVDSHFTGMTMIRSFEDEAEHKVDCIAITGLGGHAYGSFKERNGPHMWLCDDLPHDLRGARIMVYGHNTQVHNSNSFQDLEAVGGTFRSSVEALSDPLSGSGSIKPIIFIGHSLGGLVVKEAIIQLSRMKNRTRALDSIYGALFFGVPHIGMDISSLLPMIKDQPNQALIHNLGKNSQLLRSQRRNFQSAFDFEESSEIVYFYETQTSETALQGSDGIWRMRGPRAVLVDEASATAGRPWETEPHHKQAIDCNHSDLVKFAPYDESYKYALEVLRRFVSRAVTVIPRKPPLTGAQSTAGQGEYLASGPNQSSFNDHSDEQFYRPHSASHSRGTPSPRPLSANQQEQRYPSPHAQSPYSPPPPQGYSQPSYLQPYDRPLPPGETAYPQVHPSTTPPGPSYPYESQARYNAPHGLPSHAYEQNYDPNVVGGASETSWPGQKTPDRTGGILRGMKNLVLGRTQLPYITPEGVGIEENSQAYPDANTATHPTLQQQPVSNYAQTTVNPVLQQQPVPNYPQTALPSALQQTPISSQPQPNLPPPLQQTPVSLQNTSVQPPIPSRESGLGSTHPHLAGQKVAGPNWGTTNSQGWIRIPIRSRGPGVYSMIIRDPNDKAVHAGGGGRVRAFFNEKEVNVSRFGQPGATGRPAPNAIVWHLGHQQKTQRFDVEVPTDRWYARVVMNLYFAPA